MSNETKTTIKKGILAGLTELEDLTTTPTKPALKVPAKSKTDRKNNPDYTSFDEEEVIALTDNGLIEATFDIGKVQLQKLKHLLNVAGFTPDDHLFNPGLGHNHRHMNIQRITLKDHSQTLNMAIEMLYESYFALDADQKNAVDIFSETKQASDIFDSLL